MADASRKRGLEGDVRLEVIPAAGVVDKLVPVASDVPIAISASPTRGLTPTLEVAEALRRQGRTVVPHLSTRSLADARHLDQVVHRLAELGVDDVFVVGGDGSPIGPFSCALEVLRHLSEHDAPFRRAGGAAYPDYHPMMNPEQRWQNLVEKQVYANYAVTQLCFDPTRLDYWLDMLASFGVVLPIRISLAGPVRLSRLLPLVFRIGVGSSIDFLRNNSRLTSSLVGRYQPTALVEHLASSQSLRRMQLEGFHLCTFNDISASDQWRRDHSPCFESGAQA